MKKDKLTRAISLMSALGAFNSPINMLRRLNPTDFAMKEPRVLRPNEVVQTRCAQKQAKKAANRLKCYSSGIANNPCLEGVWP